MQKLFFGSIALIIIGTVFFYTVASSVEKNLNVTCQTLERQSQQFSRFWVTQSQHELCTSIGLTFTGSQNAPIHILTKENGTFEQGLWYTDGENIWKLSIYAE